MCGIVAAAARNNIVPVLLEGLRKLEYRGYDSAGLAVLNGGWLHKLSPSDFEQARRELTGEPDMAPQEAPVESLPESER